MGQHIVMHALDEIQIVFVGAAVGERQHGDRLAADRFRRRGFLCGHDRLRRLLIDPDKLVQREQRNGEQQHGDDHEIEFATGLGGNRLAAIDMLFQLQAVRRHFEGPGENQRKREPDGDQQHEEFTDPVRQFQQGYDNVHNLQQQPRDDAIDKSDPNDISSLEFSQKIPRFPHLPPVSHACERSMLVEAINRCH